MKKSINHQYMRSTNKRLILDFIRKNEPVTKKELADQLGISVTSVATFITELMEEGLISSSGNADSSGGRKSELYRLNPDSLYVFGIDIQIDRLIITLINLSGGIVKDVEIKLDQNNEWFVASLITKSLNQICETVNLPFSKIAGIGIGVPGIVNHHTGIIEFAPNLGWKNVNLTSLLPMEVPIIVENEAKAAAIGELNFGIAKAKTNLIYVSVGSGIGTGLILNGSLYYGHNFLAGEFGHMTIAPQGLPCRCGKEGCWEVYASNDAAMRLYQKKSGIKLQSFDELLEAFYQKNPDAIEVIGRIVHFLGLGIANLINGLNPEVVVIGGKIAEAESLINYRLLKEIKDHCFEYSYRGIELLFSRLKNQATALGAANLMIDGLLANLK